MTVEQAKTKVITGLKTLFQSWQIRLKASSTEKKKKVCIKECTEDDRVISNNTEDL